MNEMLHLQHRIQHITYFPCMLDCYFSDIQAISKFFFMLRLDAIRITRVLWFIQFVLDKIHQVKNDFPLCGQLRSKKRSEN